MAFGGRNGEVGAKTLAGAFQQLSRGLEVDFRAGDSAVTQIGREEWQFGREIGPLPIPRQEAMHGEGVAQVMNARAWLTLGTAKTNTAQQFQIERHEARMSVPGADDVQEDRRCGGGRKTGVTALMQILFQ